MLNFKEYLVEQELLAEKLLLINNGKRYGQIVFLAGGAGSGKGFAGENFMNSQDYKVRDVDEMKKQYLKLNKEKDRYPELKGINLKNPNDVMKLHAFVKKKGTVAKTLASMLAATKNVKTLPNIIFDVTLKNIKKLKDTVMLLAAQGYESRNIHLVWVLTDYKIAVAANRERERVVPDDILLMTHIGAHKTMWDIIGKRNIPNELGGGIYVILNNREHTVVYTGPDGKPIRGGKYGKDAGKKKTIKDFKYLIFKEPGKSPQDESKIKIQLYTWIVNNVPLTKDGVFSDG